MHKFFFSLMGNVTIHEMILYFSIIYDLFVGYLKIFLIFNYNLRDVILVNTLKVIIVINLMYQSTVNLSIVSQIIYI